MIYVEFILCSKICIYTRVPLVGLVSMRICSWDLKVVLKRLCHLSVCYLWSCGKELILTAALAAVLYSLRPLMPISRKTAYSDAMNE